MKMIYGGVPITSMKVNHYELSTSDATVQPSDLQAGITCYARGAKVTGTGKSFEFAFYGGFSTNDFAIIPSSINVIHISSSEYPVQDVVALNDIKNLDFTNEQIVSNVVIDGEVYPIKVTSTSSELNITCDRAIVLEVFYGKDNYV